ncbi:MAG: RNA polymerase sigma factor, partial [Planctomycetota bacterium]
AAFTTILEQGMRPRPDSNPRTWLLGVVRNHARMQIRGNVRRRGREHRAAVREEGAAMAADPGEAVVQDETRRLVRACIDELPERDRDLLHLHYVEGMSYSAIAEVLAVPQGSVAAWLNRGRKRLRQHLRRAGVPAALGLLLLLRDLAAQECAPADLRSDLARRLHAAPAPVCLPPPVLASEAPLPGYPRWGLPVLVGAGLLVLLLWWWRSPMADGTGVQPGRTGSDAFRPARMSAPEQEQGPVARMVDLDWRPAAESGGARLVDWSAAPFVRVDPPGSQVLALLEPSGVVHELLDEPAPLQRASLPDAIGLVAPGRLSGDDYLLEWRFYVPTYYNPHNIGYVGLHGLDAARDGAFARAIAWRWQGERMRIRVRLHRLERLPGGGGTWQVDLWQDDEHRWSGPVQARSDDCCLWTDYYALVVEDCRLQELHLDGPGTVVGPGLPDL